MPKNEDSPRRGIITRNNFLRRGKGEDQKGKNLKPSRGGFVKVLKDKEKRERSGGNRKNSGGVQEGGFVKGWLFFPIPTLVGPGKKTA